MKIENYQVFHLSERAKVILCGGKDSATIVKRVSPLGEASIKLTREELEQLFAVFNGKRVIDSVIGSDTIAESETKKEGNAE